MLKGKKTIIAVCVGVAIVAFGAVQQKFGLNIIDPATIAQVKDALMLAALLFIRTGIASNGGNGK